MAPLLFLLFIDTVTDSLLTNHALFMDDLSVWESASSKEDASKAVQEAVDHVSEWSRVNKLSLNPTKCEVTYFSSGSADAKWKPHLRLHGGPMPFNATPRFLGVKLDRGLTFHPHVEEITLKATKRTKLLRAVSSKNWGWQKKSLRKIYQATQRSLMDCSGPPWQSFHASVQRSSKSSRRRKTRHCVQSQVTRVPHPLKLSELKAASRAMPPTVNV